MTLFGLFGFGAPWVLAALVALPAVWLLLRVIPPAPRRQVFPPLRLLHGLSAQEDTSARTPLWLLLLRLLAVLLVILGLAQPMLSPQPAATSGDRPLLLVIDDDWAAAAAWEDRRQALLAALDRAALRGQPVRLLTTAPPADGGPVRVGRLSTAEEARAEVSALTPKPWAADHASVLQALNAEGDALRAADPVIVTNGLGQTATPALLEALRRRGPLAMIAPPPGREPLLLGPVERTAEGVIVTVHRPTAEGTPPPERAVTVRAVDAQGRAVGAGPVILAAGESTGRGVISLPADLRAALARIEALPMGGLEAPGAGGVVLLDDGWRQRPVAIVSGAATQAGVPLLADGYYLHRALSPHAEIAEASLADAIGGRAAVILMTDGARGPAAEAESLGAWVEAGGVLVRFAGPRLNVSTTADPLLPVAVRGGGRTLGGALSWTQPQTLAPFPDRGPFAGLRVPDDVTVHTQVLADPSADLPDRTWARLADGTPLVTGARRGQGWVVLVHTTANAEWSNLALSGLFPDMLRRLIGLADATGGPTGGPTGGDENLRSGPLPPLETLDGFGRLGEAPATVRSLEPSAGPPAVGPATPPGYYGRSAGHDAARTALNLSGAESPPQGLGPLPAGVQRLEFGAATLAIDLRPFFLGAALLLLLIDLLISYGLRGLLGRRTAAAGVAGLAAVLALAPGAGQAMDPDALALEAALNTRLAHVETGDPEVDTLARDGLNALTRVLAQRSSAELAPPMTLDINRDELAFFPLLYWPAVDGQTLPDTAARARVVDYMAQGGMILFDGRGPENARALRLLLETVGIAPLTPVPEDHVVNRTFYLLRSLPGRLEGGPVWLEQAAADETAVSAVLIGSNDWAGAWARDEAGRPRLPVVPGGERSRELAYRAGVNIVMYALTGNYKADQVHLPIIMERLTQ